MMKNIFQEQFIKLLKEDLNDEENDLALAGDEEDGREAFENSLDDGTDPKDYDVNPNNVKQIGRKNIEEAKKWVQILNDFSDLINSAQDSDSLNNFLNRVDREGSAFRGIVRSQGKRTTRIAEECAAMAQVLESNIIGYDKKERELLQQFPNLQA